MCAAPWHSPAEAVADPAAAFDADGVAALGPLLDADQLETVRAALAGLSDRVVVGPYAGIVHDAWRHAPALAALVPQLGAIACRALGFPALVLFHDHILIKPPHGDDMDWHQDFSYLPIDRPDGLTLWIALDDVTLANGCLWYRPGTHRQGERRASWGLVGDGDARALLPPIEVAEGEPGIAAPTAAGCAIAHHTCVWHRSPRNRSAVPRRSWALSFTVPEARWSPRHAPHPRSAMSPREEGESLEDDLPRASLASGANTR